jgi:hypothetical protein
MLEVGDVHAIIIMHKHWEKGKKKKKDCTGPTRSDKSASRLGCPGPD